jgi:hypothetical protein
LDLSGEFEAMGRHHSAGDIHDYFKLGFLRTLAYSGFKLGIQCYFNGEKEPFEYGSGPYTRYLGNPQRYKACDPELFQSLKAVQCQKQGQKGFLHKIAQSHLFPGETVFYTDPLNFENMPLNYREQHRLGWFAFGQKQMHDRDVVFLNPKCGLQIKTINPYCAINGPNYVSEAELKSFSPGRQTLVIYQRIARSSLFNAFATYSQKIQFLSNYPEVDYLQFTEGSPSLLLIVPAAHHREQLNRVLKTYRTSNWARFLSEAALLDSEASLPAR